MSLEDINRKSQDFSFLSPSILKWFEAPPLRQSDVTLYRTTSCDGGREKGKSEGNCECFQSLLLCDLKSLNLSTFLFNESGSSESLKQLLPFLNHMSHLAHTVSSRSFRLEWTHMAEILHATSAHLTSLHVAHHYLVLLQITAITERILGKVFLLKGKTVPFLLRDLLDTSEMKTLLGKDLVAFLKTLIGSVHGLNVRNLAWHGFLGVPDIRREHSLVLLFAIHKVGEALNGKILTTGPASLVLPEAEGLSAPNICLEEDPLEIISNSSLVYAVMLPLWQEAVILISRRVKEVVLLLLPLLENALRVLYATVNGCPARILTATNASFYVTMDEILSPWMTTPSRTPESIENDDASSDRILHPNFVPQYLGRQLTEALYDLFHYPSGPRLRDRVSHGEALPESVPFGMTCHLFRLCLLVLSAERWRFMGDFSRFTIRCSCESVSEGLSPRKCFPHYASETEAFLISSFASSSSPLCPLNTRLLSYLSSYESSFHPSSIFKKSLLEAFESLEGWKDWARPPPHLVPESCWQDYDAASDPLYGLKWHTVFGSYQPRNLNGISDVKALVTCPNTTLFSSKLELEILRTLQRVLNCLQKVLSNVSSSLAARHSSYASKTMRSRQREAYLRQLRSLPGVASHLFAALQLLRLVFSFSGKWRCAETSVASPFKTLLRQVLKATENLVTFTDPSVNNYHQAFETLKQNTQTICDCFRDERSHLP